MMRHSSKSEEQTSRSEGEKEHVIGSHRIDATAVTAEAGHDATLV